MKTKTKVVLTALLCATIIMIPFSNSASSKSRIEFWSTPTEITKTVAAKANEWATNVQDTKLDGINNNESSSLNSQYQISRTLMRLANDENGVIAYIQWTLYIWLVAATILLIWNGFKLVTPDAKMNDVKERIKNILLWVILMTSFLAIIKLMTALLNLFFS